METRPSNLHLLSITSTPLTPDIILQRAREVGSFNPQDELGRTPLMWAVLEGNLSFANGLLNFNNDNNEMGSCDMTVKDSEHKTCLDLAVEENHLNVFEDFIKNLLTGEVPAAQEANFNEAIVLASPETQAAINKKIEALREEINEAQELRRFREEQLKFKQQEYHQLMKLALMFIKVTFSLAAGESPIKNMLQKVYELNLVDQFFVFKENGGTDTILHDVFARAPMVNLPLIVYAIVRLQQEYRQQPEALLRYLIIEKNENGETPFMLLAQRQPETRQEIQALISLLGIEIDNHKNTLLHYLLKNGNIKDIATLKKNIEQALAELPVTDPLHATFNALLRDKTNNEHKTPLEIMHENNFHGITIASSPKTPFTPITPNTPGVPGAFVQKRVVPTQSLAQPLMQPPPAAAPLQPPAGPSRSGRPFLAIPIRNPSFFQNPMPASENSRVGIPSSHLARSTPSLSGETGAPSTNLDLNTSPSSIDSQADAAASPSNVFDPRSAEKHADDASASYSSYTGSSNSNSESHSLTDEERLRQFVGDDVDLPLANNAPAASPTEEASDEEDLIHRPRPKRRPS